MVPNPHIQVAVGIVVRPEPTLGVWQVLVSRRSEKQALAGMWEFPGGKLEPDESAQACVVRELREELGVDVRPTSALDPIEHRYDHAHVVIWPFYAEHVGGEPRAIEVADWKWVEVAALDTLRFPPANATLLSKIKQDYGGKRTG